MVTLLGESQADHQKNWKNQIKKKTPTIPGYCRSFFLYLKSVTGDLLKRDQRFSKSPATF